MNFEDYMGWKLSAKRSRGDWRFGDHEFSVSVTKPPKRDKTGRLIPSRLRTSTVKNPDTTSGDLDEKTTAPFMSPSERRKGYRTSNKASSVRENSPEWQKKWGRGLVERVINRASEFGDMNEFISGSLKRRLSPEQQEAHTRSYRRGQFSPWAWYSSSQGGGKTWSRPDASIGHRGSAGAGKKGGPYRLNPMRGKGEYGQSVRDTLKERGDKEKISGVARGQSMYSPSSKGRSPEGTIYRQQRDRKQIYSSEFGDHEFVNRPTRNTQRMGAVIREGARRAGVNEADRDSASRYNEDYSNAKTDADEMVRRQNRPSAGSLRGRPKGHNISGTSARLLRKAMEEKGMLPNIQRGQASEFGETMRNFGDDQFLLFFANQYPEAFQEVAGEFYEFGSERSGRRIASRQDRPAHQGGAMEAAARSGLRGSAGERSQGWGETTMAGREVGKGAVISSGGAVLVQSLPS